MTYYVPGLDKFVHFKFCSRTLCFDCLLRRKMFVFINPTPGGGGVDSAPPLRKTASVFDRFNLGPPNSLTNHF